jgi:hypothetical protein
MKYKKETSWKLEGSSLPLRKLDMLQIAKRWRLTLLTNESEDIVQTRFIRPQRMMSLRNLKKSLLLWMLTQTWNQMNGNADSVGHQVLVLKTLSWVLVNVLGQLDSSTWNASVVGLKSSAKQKHHPTFQHSSGSLSNVKSVRTLTHLWLRLRAELTI